MSHTVVEVPKPMDVTVLLKRIVGVVLDVVMPEMGGIEAARHIRRMQGEAANIPIIALTADALPGDRERYLEAGMSDYLPKPVRKPDLLAMVASWVDGAAADRRAQDTSVR